MTYSRGKTPHQPENKTRDDCNVLYSELDRKLFSFLAKRYAPTRALHLVTMLCKMNFYVPNSNHKAEIYATVEFHLNSSNCLLCVADVILPRLVTTAK